MSRKRIVVVTERCIFWDPRKTATHILIPWRRQGSSTTLPRRVDHFLQMTFYGLPVITIHVRQLPIQIVAAVISSMKPTVVHSNLISNGFTKRASTIVIRYTSIIMKPYGDSHCGTTSGKSARPGSVVLVRHATNQEHHSEERHEPTYNEKTNSDAPRT